MLGSVDREPDLLAEELQHLSRVWIRSDLVYFPKLAAVEVLLLCCVLS